MLLRHLHVLVMTDDIYKHIRFDNTPNPHFLNAAPELKQRTLAINGVSKTCTMTGFRIGWVAGPKDLVHGISTLLSQAVGNCCSVSQATASAALNGDQSFIQESVETSQMGSNIKELFSIINNCSIRPSRHRQYNAGPCRRRLHRKPERP